MSLREWLFPQGDEDLTPADLLIETVMSAIPLAGVCIYEVQGGSEPARHRIRGLSAMAAQSYFENFWLRDPLHPLNTAGLGQRVRHFGEEDVLLQGRHREYFYDFLMPQGTVHQTEVYLHEGTKVVAGMSLLRTGVHGPLTAANATFLDRLSCLVEGRHRGEEVPLDEGRLRLLTRREREIFEMLLVGACNKDICRGLGLELPTVKTHVSRVLRKLGVQRRVELVRRR